MGSSEHPSHDASQASGFAAAPSRCVGANQRSAASGVGWLVWQAEPVDQSHVEDDLELDQTLFTEEQILGRLKEMAGEIERDYAGRDLLLVGVLRGAVMVMADLARSLNRHIEMDWMAVSSYGSGTKSSGVVRILKDLDTDLQGRDVLIVEDIIDTGLTLSWLVTNLRSRGPASVEIATLLRKPDAVQTEIDVKYVGFDIPNAFVVGYGLDFDEKYRNLRCIGTLAPHVYS
jgi:hypoxanthine phosphoribosyltransferase